ncbi:ATPase domain-containing protein [Calothrix sp. 336/3]|uniref:ATPase domain-containing protein n=1 Tax=Calothrix sp. 336/3 TaxID=1337936 RepID=UPI0004E3D375|nr:ATPase domain-containing protein [Calothrix sp. 336/3]AKG20069.1 recombinase RecA [Calothrix sp. 336/3]
MPDIRLMSTGVPNLDAVLGGGIPVYSLNILAGSPGSGKTILAQQILFNSIQHHPQTKGIYLSTLSEPSVKVVRYMQYFDFFDGAAFGEQVIYRDLGGFLYEQPLSGLAEQIVTLVHQYQAEILVIDSFKAIHDLTENLGEFRRFCYDLSVRLASARCTTFLVTESDRTQITQGAEFAIADGIFYLCMSKIGGEQSRFFQIYKLRGRDSQMEAFPFTISSSGVRIFSPALTLRRQRSNLEREEQCLHTGISGLDPLLKGGIPLGRSIILSGVSGTGKTTFGLQFLITGAANNERGLLFSFEETADRLYKTAAGFGWDLAPYIAQDILRIVFVPQTDIRLEEQLENIVEAVENFQPRRFVLDSLSVFLYKVNDSATQREKTFQLATIVQRVGGVGLLISDIPAEEKYRLSRFGVEETIADGTIVLSTEVTGKRRDRYIEVFKMRAADYISGRHRLEITPHGIEVLYLGGQTAPSSELTTPPTLTFEPLQGLIQGELSFNTSWLLQGEPGLGKSTLAYQFAMEGLRRQESVLYIGADVPQQQIRQSLENFGFFPTPYLESGNLLILDVFSAGENSLSLEDPERFLFTVSHFLAQMPRPCRVVLDSLTPLAINYPHADFVTLVHRKNRLLRQPGVVLFDIFLTKILNQSDLYGLLNTFDVVIDLYIPNWGEMNRPGNLGYPSLRVVKSRGTRADTRPYPYRISQTEGIVVQQDYYH